MIYEMKLQPKYYDFITSGTKRIEIRLFDEKREKIKLGDIIEFKKMPNLDESFQAKVIGLLRYDSLDNLLDDFDISLLADKSMTKKELKNELEKFYSYDARKLKKLPGVIFCRNLWNFLHKPRNRGPPVSGKRF